VIGLDNYHYQKHKMNIYDRIPSTPTADLAALKRLWTMLIAQREGTPKHDYHGKCLMRATLELERRGATTSHRLK
jgi:hypothetical protein